MKCRLCGSENHDVVLELAPTPIANDFRKWPDKGTLKHPLRLQKCGDCGHVQLADKVDVSWNGYPYVTPEAVRPYLRETAAGLRARYPNARTVLEIGCNSGMNMQELRAAGFESVTGIDPAAKDWGIPRAFTSKFARLLPDRYDLVIANNVLAHVDDLEDVLHGISHVLADGGNLVFENQYLPSMVDSCLYDMIYHEHRDYHSLGPLVRTLGRYDLALQSADFTPMHGGSFRAHVGRDLHGVFCEDQIDWSDFARRISAANADLCYQIDALDGQVACFGASAKATTLIHNAGLVDRLAFCVDSTPAKQGRYIPGTDIQIFPEELLRKQKPAAVLLTAWNYEAEIRARFPDINFIVPFRERLKEAA